MSIACSLGGPSHGGNAVHTGKLIPHSCAHFFERAELHVRVTEQVMPHKWCTMVSAFCSFRPTKVCSWNPVCHYDCTCARLTLPVFFEQWGQQPNKVHPSRYQYKLRFPHSPAMSCYHKLAHCHLHCKIPGRWISKAENIFAFNNSDNSQCWF